MLSLSLIILFLLVHHAFTHENNEPFSIIDFQHAFNGSFKSHEGIILVSLLVTFGILLGSVFKWK